MNRIALSAVVALIGSSTSVPALGDDDPAVDCNSAQSTYEMNVCSDRELQSADAELNLIYKKALEHVAQNGSEKPYDAESWQKALRESQRAWIAFRDADCKGLVPMAWSGGSGTTVEVLGCMIDKTKTRSQELRDRYELK